MVDTCVFRCYAGTEGEQMSLPVILVSHLFFICANNFRVERTISGKRITNKTGGRKKVKVALWANFFLATWQQQNKT